MRLPPCLPVTTSPFKPCVRGNPAEREAVHLTSTDDKFTVGSWRAEPYAEYIENYPGDEYTRVLESL